MKRCSRCHDTGWLGGQSFHPRDEHSGRELAISVVVDGRYCTCAIGGEQKREADARLAPVLGRLRRDARALRDRIERDANIIGGIPSLLCDCRRCGVVHVKWDSGSVRCESCKLVLAVYDVDGDLHFVNGAKFVTGLQLEEQEA